MPRLEGRQLELAISWQPLSKESKHAKSKQFAGYPLSSDYDSFELVLGRTTLGFISWPE